MKSNLFNWDERPSKRIRKIENALKNDPFLYHKKKNVISSRFNDSNEEDGQNTNQELLLFQDENNKHINSLKNKIITKASTIENNAHNYLNFIMKEKSLNPANKVVPTDPGSPPQKIFGLNYKNQRQINQNPYQESFTPNKYTYNKYNNITLSNYRNNSLNGRSDDKLVDELNFGNKLTEQNLPIRKNGSISYKVLPTNNLNYEDNNNINIINNNNDNDINNNYLQKIQNFKETTDITDHNYYDKISKQLILQMNKNYMDYNQNLINKRYSPNSGNKFAFLRNKQLAIPPGHISNPKYYNLGESRLKSNPIVNPGNRAPIFNRYNNHNHKLKSELY